MNIERNLELLGLSNKEARIYTTALPLGEFTVADISKKSGIKRPTCYIILDELTKRGIVSVILKGKKRLYKTESPHILIRQAKRNFQYAEKIAPSLLNLYKEDGQESSMKFYYGQKGIQNIYEDMLNSGVKIVKYVGSSGPLVEMAGDEFMRDYVKRRVAKKIKTLSIRMRDTEIPEPIYGGGSEFLREIRYAPKDIYIPDTVYIYGNKIAIISTTKNNFGFMIENPELSKTLSGLFEALWRISSEK